MPDKGKGCVATQDIPAGAVVFMEQALMRVRDDASWADYIAAYEALSPDDKASVLELYGNFKQRIADSAEHELSQPRADGSYLLTRVKKHYLDVIFKFDTNSFYMEDEDPDDDDKPGTSGLFPRTSRFNHSCDPNLQYSVEWTPGWWICKAKRDIRSGEELTIEYVPRVWSVTERTEALSKWGFTCNCSACIADRQGAAAFKTLRETMNELDLSGETTGPETNKLEEKGPIKDNTKGADDDDDDETDEVQAQYDRLFAKIEELEARDGGGIELFFRSVPRYCYNILHCH